MKLRLMQTKTFQAATLDALETAVNTWLAGITEGELVSAHFFTEQVALEAVFEWDETGGGGTIPESTTDFHAVIVYTTG